MQHKTLFALLVVLCLVLVLGGGFPAARQTQAQEPPPSDDSVEGGSEVALQGTALGTAFTYQGRLTDTGGQPVPGPCSLRFTLYQSASGNDPVGSPQTKTGVALDNGYFGVELDFGAGAFNGEARYVKIEVNCGTAYTTLAPRVKLNPAPHALALPGLRTEQHATSPNVIGGYSGNSVDAGVYGATIGGGGESGSPNRVTYSLGTVGGGRGNTASSFATVAGGWSNTASNGYATVGGGTNNIASASGATVAGGATNMAGGYFTAVGGGEGNTAGGYASTVPGGSYAYASLTGQMAYASGKFANSGDAQASLYIMRRQTTSTGAWDDLYLDGSSQLLILGLTRTLAFDILVVGRTEAGESAGYYVWGLAENVGGTTTVWASTTVLREDDATWDVRAIGNVGNHLALQVKGNGETIRWVATVRTTGVYW